MFTGLIQRVGTVKRVSFGRGLVLEFDSAPWDDPLVPGESIAVDGTCLTVACCSGSRWTANVLDETASRTGLAEFRPGRRVNMERALRAGDRMGGHVVQGHVDGRGKIAARIPKGRDFALKISCPRAIAAATVPKGSIAVDGVSLTVSGLGADWIQVDVIPSTAAETTLGERRPGDAVNLESDVLGRYAIRGASAGEAACGEKEGGLTMDMLAENGFL